MGSRVRWGELGKMYPRRPSLLQLSLLIFRMGLLLITGAAGLPHVGPC